MTKKNKQIIIVISIVAVIAVAVGLFVWLTHKEMPQVAKDPTTMEPQEIRSYFESEEFMQLPISEKAKFVESIPQNQMRAIMRPPMSQNGERPRPNPKVMQQMRKIMEYQMEQRLNAFFAASPEEQQRMLDEDIDRMERMRAEMRPRGQNRPRPNGNAPQVNNGQNNQNRPQRPQMDEQGRRDREASMNPATRAKMRIYFEKLRQRQQERSTTQK